MQGENSKATHIVLDRPLPMGEVFLPKKNGQGRNREAKHIDHVGSPPMGKAFLPN